MMDPETIYPKKTSGRMLFKILLVLAIVALIKSQTVISVTIPKGQTASFTSEELGYNANDYFTTEQYSNLNAAQVEVAYGSLKYHQVDKIFYAWPSLYDDKK
jgi:hypothetical protein